jgi:hypothetical protein
MTADDKLRSLFADQAPPSSDALFVFGVQQALARRRLLDGMLALCAWAVSATALLWLAAGWAEPLIYSLAPTLNAAAPPIVLAITATLWITPRMRLT